MIQEKENLIMKNINRKNERKQRVSDILSWNQISAIFAYRSF